MTPNARPRRKPESPIRGLYAIADQALLGADRIVACAEQALLGGARVLQYRAKNIEQVTRVEVAVALAAVCARHQVCFIVNDDIDAAAASGAHGVHLGRADTDIAAARARLGPRALIGASCYDELGRAERAVAAGADYVAFGSFFASPTKPGTVRAQPDLLRRARAVLEVPIVAIGGINTDNAGELLAAGADAVAVISDVFAADDIRTAAARYRALLG